MILPDAVPLSVFIQDGAISYTSTPKGLFLFEPYRKTPKDFRLYQAGFDDEPFQKRENILGLLSFPFTYTHTRASERASHSLRTKSPLAPRGSMFDDDDDVDKYKRR